MSNRRPVKIRREWSSQFFDSEPDASESEVTIYLSAEDEQKIREIEADRTIDLKNRIRRLRSIYIKAGAGDVFPGWGPLPDSSPIYAQIAEAPHKITQGKEVSRFGTTLRMTKAFLAVWISFELTTFIAFHFTQDFLIGSMFFWGVVGGLIVGLPIAWQTDLYHIPGRTWVYRYSPVLFLILASVLGLLLIGFRYDRWVILVSFALFSVFALWLYFQLPMLLRLRRI